ncbi:MAG: phosphatidylserine decarboxylase family protein [Bacteroidaceae bacterium]|nr:phosphatidylserine decarboxylase family protein [Bacteroidaceae bacterium]
MGNLKKIKKIRNIRIHREGTEILVVSFLILLLINVPLWYFLPSWVVFNSVVSIATISTYVLMVNFFRSPIRRFQGDVDDIVVAPADGKIVVIEKVFEPDHFKAERILVSIFMSPMNVHANWYPVDGVVKRVEHQKGKFHKAWLPKASTENERSLVVIEMPNGEELLVRQIAGAMARRIVTYSIVGEECLIDQHMGFIKFGSRVDVYLPLDAEVCVALDQKTVGNQTVIAKLK